MKVYTFTILSVDDYCYAYYFTSKTKALREYKKCLKIEAKRNLNTDEYDEDDEAGSIQQVYDLYDFEVELTKKGVMEMLNSRFRKDD